MQTLIEGNVIGDFSDKSVVVIGKVEIDSDGKGNYQVLPDVTDFNFSSSEENEVNRFCACSFSITCLNTDKRYFSWNTASPYYNWLKQGRRIKIWAGVKAKSPESQYPPAQSDTYVKSTTKLGTAYWAYYTTDPAEPLTGTWYKNQWLADQNTNQRFHIDLGEAKIIGRIYYENSHSDGDGTDSGVKNFTFWGSNAGAGTFDDLVYGNDEGWTELTVAQNTFDQHVALDQADPKYITVTNTTAYRYYAFKFADNYGGALIGVRRIELQTEDYYYQWLIGRIDDYSLSTVAGKDICTISGRDFMRTILDYKLYSPNTHWGTKIIFDTVANQADYQMLAACKGIYIAYLDSIDPYDGSHLAPIYKDRDFGYVESDNKFSFLADIVPTYNGTNNLVVYYFQAKSIESVVGDILYHAGIFATTGARDTWVADTDYVTPIGKEIDRVWFNTGTSAFEAIRLLAEVVQYRFYFDYAGNPIFKPKVSISTSVDTFSDDCITNQRVSEDIDEVYNHIIIVGESRETLG